MTLDELRARFPQASDWFIKANADILSDRAGAAPVLEHRAGVLPVAADQAQEAHRPGFLVRVVSVRKRLLDEDNLCEKFHIDLCRYAGALPLDSPETCRIETTQRKAAKGEEEHTMITVLELPNNGLEVIRSLLNEGWREDIMGQVFVSRDRSLVKVVWPDGRTVETRIEPNTDLSDRRE